MASIPTSTGFGISQNHHLSPTTGGVMLLINNQLRNLAGYERQRGHTSGRPRQPPITISDRFSALEKSGNEDTYSPTNAESETGCGTPVSPAPPGMVPRNGKGYAKNGKDSRGRKGATPTLCHSFRANLGDSPSGNSNGHGPQSLGRGRRRAPIDWRIDNAKSQINPVTAGEHDMLWGTRIDLPQIVEVKDYSRLRNSEGHKKNDEALSRSRNRSGACGSDPTAQSYRRNNRENTNSPTQKNHEKQNSIKLGSRPSTFGEVSWYSPGDPPCGNSRACPPNQRQLTSSQDVKAREFANFLGSEEDTPFTGKQESQEGGQNAANMPLKHSTVMESCLVTDSTEICDNPDGDYFAVVRVTPQAIESRTLRWSWSGEGAEPGAKCLTFISGEITEILAHHIGGWSYGRIKNQDDRYVRRYSHNTMINRFHFTGSCRCRKGWFPTYMIDPPCQVLAACDESYHHTGSIYPPWGIEIPIGIILCAEHSKSIECLQVTNGIPE